MSDDEIVENDKEKPKFRIGIGHQNGFVFIEFNQPTQKFIMTKQQAREFCRRLSKETY